MVSLRVQRTTMVLQWFCLGSQDKAMFLQWIYLGFKEAALVLKWSCLNIIRIQLKNIGFIYKIAQDTSGHPKRIGFPEVLIKTN